VDSEQEVAKTPAPPGWDPWKRVFRIEAQRELIEAEAQQLADHLAESPPSGAKPGCFVYTVLAYVIAGFCFMWIPPAWDLAESVGYSNLGYLLLALLVGVGVHAFRPRPKPVDDGRVAALQLLLGHLSEGPFAAGAWEGARWDLELDLRPLGDIAAESERQSYTGGRTDITDTRELTWLRLQGQGQGRKIDLQLEREHSQRTVYREEREFALIGEGEVTKSSIKSKTPDHRYVLRAKLEANELDLNLARQVLDSYRDKPARPKAPLEEREGSLRMAWVFQGFETDVAVRLLADLGEALAAGAP
jgi:hypothetical protein